MKTFESFTCRVVKKVLNSKYICLAFYALAFWIPLAGSPVLHPSWSPPPCPSFRRPHHFPTQYYIVIVACLITVYADFRWNSTSNHTNKYNNQLDNFIITVTKLSKEEQCDSEIVRENVMVK